MTPLAEKLFKAPLTRDQRNLVGEALSGCQFYEVSALLPVVDARERMPFSEKYLEELGEGHVPAEACWFEFSRKTAIALLYLPTRRRPKYRSDARYAGFGVQESSQGLALSEFVICEPSPLNLEIRLAPWRESHFDADKMLKWAERAVKAAWFCIEAMQTPGFTSSGSGGLSRQQERQRKRRGEPVHKWVTVYLGRPRPASGGGRGSGRTVAWHYRNGHRINHPNPNFPKWRKGCWVGNPANGIRSHDYVIEVPD